MKNIYQVENEGFCDGMNEIAQYDIEDKFVNALCELIYETLEISHNERRIVMSLLKNGLKRELNTRYKDMGLLQQYEAYILDKSSESIISELDLGDVKINHSNVTHAKFRNIINAIKEKYINNTEKNKNAQ